MKTNKPANVRLRLPSPQMLIDLLRKEGLNDGAIAKRIGNANQTTIGRIRRGEATPGFFVYEGLFGLVREICIDKKLAAMKRADDEGLQQFFSGASHEST